MFVLLDYICSKQAREDLRRFLMGKVDNSQLSKLDCKNQYKSKLFKYSTVNEHIHSNIKNNYLIANRPGNFNDIYDSTMHSSTFSKNMSELNESKQLSSSLGYGSAYNGFTEGYIKKFSEDQDKHLMTYFQNDFFISCLAGTNMDNLMWSHYADKHTGICVEYDFKKANNDINHFLYPVIYTDCPIDITDLMSNDDKIPLALLVSIICKSIDWRYENEWRLISYMPSQKQEKQSASDFIKLIAPAISTIYLGHRFIQSFDRKKTKESDAQYRNYELLIKAITDKNITTELAKPHIGAYQLEFDYFDLRKLI